MSLVSAADAVRATGIGASEIAAVCGISPYDDQWSIYAQKKGLIRPKEQTERMFWGKKLEPLIAEVFAERMGVRVEWWNRRIHSTRYPWQYASPDAFIVSAEGVRDGVLECKTAGLDQAGEWDRDADDEDGVPEYYVVQVQWQMSTCGLLYAYIVVLIAGNDFRIYRIEYDPVLEDILIQEAEDFWRMYILAQRVPPISGSDRARDYLRQRHPRDRGVIRRANLRETDLLNEYAHLRNLLDQAKAKRKQMENEITQAIGDDAGLEWDGGRFTWRRTKDSHPIYWEGLAKSRMADSTEEERKEIIKQFTLTKPGYRRIHFRDEEDE